MIKDKTGLFNSVKLQEIHSVVKDNNRAIAENSIKIDLVHDDVTGLKEEILEMKEINLNIQEISLEMRKNSYETNKLIEKVINDIATMQEYFNTYDKVM